MKIIQRGERVELTRYYRMFDDPECVGAGAMFACDPTGEPAEPEHPAGRDNLRDCLSGASGYIDRGAVAFGESYTTPTLGKCDCGHILTLDAFTNTCRKCGSDYNSSGQSLAPRSQWGWDTGETLDEILAIGHDIS